MDFGPDSADPSHVLTDSGRLLVGVGRCSGQICSVPRRFWPKSIEVGLELGLVIGPSVWAEVARTRPPLTDFSPVPAKLDTGSAVFLAMSASKARLAVRVVARPTSSRFDGRLVDPAPRIHEVGGGFYAVARKETIQAAKEMLLQDIENDTFTVGASDCREKLGWPAGGELKKGPGDVLAGHRLFVQSTSFNRVIPPETHVLFEAGCSAGGCQLRELFQRRVEPGSPLMC